jgi:hypothetical protein
MPGPYFEICRRHCSEDLAPTPAPPAKKSRANERQQWCDEGSSSGDGSTAKAVTAVAKSYAQELRSLCEALPLLEVGDEGSDWFATLRGRTSHFVDVYSPEDRALARPTPQPLNNVVAMPLTQDWG